MNAAGRLLAHASILLTPVVYPQGVLTRLKIGKLPEAAGERVGRSGQGTNVLRVLLLGESTIAGVGVTDHGQGLAGQLAVAISAMTGATVDWRVLAANGLTAAGLRARLKELPPDTRADVIVIGLGANDVFRMQGPVGWERDLHALIDAVRERCGFAPVMLSAIPPIGKFPALPQPLRSVLGLRALLLDHASRKLATSMAGVYFVPVDFEITPELFAEDGIHPSARCYTLLGRAIAEAALDRLPKRG